jgi:hypothetical protein
MAKSKHFINKCGRIWAMSKHKVIAISLDKEIAAAVDRRALLLSNAKSADSFARHITRSGFVEAAIRHFLRTVYKENV